MPRAKGGTIPPPRSVIPPGYGGVISDLRENDVLSGRGGRINNHPGNIMFRTVVEDYKREYLDPRTRKLEKAHVAARLVAQIRNSNPPGRFLKEDPDNPGKYIEIGDQKAFKKAGQALREDAPDVRKEIDEEMENVAHYTQQPTYQCGIPHGIPPSVSYSPSSAGHHLGPPPPGPRPDPPESGVSGYRQPPLPYLESGRGQMRPGHWPGRGAPPPPPPQRHSQFQPLPLAGHRPYPPPGPHGGYPPPTYYGSGYPPPPHVQQPHNQTYPHQPPPYCYSGQPLQGRPYPHNTSTPLPKEHPQSNGQRNPKPATPAPNTPIVAGAVSAVITGVTQTVGAVSELTSKVKKQSNGPKSAEVPSDAAKGQFRQSLLKRQVGFSSSDIPLAASTATNFTMSDVSEFSGANIFASIDEEKDRKQPKELLTIKPLSVEKDSSGTTKSSSGKSRDSMMSELSISGIRMSGIDLTYASLGQSFGTSGRTRSFPDLMLSTGEEPLPSMPLAESDKDTSDTNDAGKKKKKSGRLLKPMAHRASSSESSASSMASIRFEKGFHPVRSRTNTGLSISALNDAMSIMSMDSRKSMSDNSSWLDAFKSMQSINSDANTWENDGSARPQVWNDDGSIRSLLTDVSSDLNALDLAEPLLPPYLSESGLDDSGFIIKPDP
mmetsp:Transcript_12330/g.25999  ORF Transcript_12330/g.25999 Transcript_12330/m.25999 type:complete len:661 (+) Transcript_12330:314-2296(+)|eukprot:CAMPEP_0171419214 /NCGR_PEP_ID=MMETSP0880-20121228/41496_1 /TAXON_ID=67004 /ORGANISM="Thalassiosira weissflogii, Strain CCMP1336" /LENGTH=660 /DNA_ID=CAMNT_0011937491 /DNA_START=741 /DNA_END=2723 /DNA_ORIENTATION=-